MPEYVYLNGQFVPYDQAKLPIEDRGTVFADGVYEVVRFYGRRPFFLDEHLQRLKNSMAEIRIPAIDLDQLRRDGCRLVEMNGVVDGGLYIQVTRGVAPRSHTFPADVTPTVFMTAREAARPPEELRNGGIACITTPDVRWLNCHIKSIGLLPNVLAKQQAKEQGAYEALFVRGENLTEGSSSNLFGVKDGRLYTHPEGPLILPGITRRAVLDIATREGIPVTFEPIRCADWSTYDELFISGTITEVLGIVSLDGKPVKDGKVGPVTRKIIERFDEMILSVSQQSS